jgi:hypothetical protein
MGSISIAKRAYKAHKKLDKDECQPTAANVADDLAEPAAAKEAA